MALITLTIPDTEMQGIQDSLCAAGGYSPSSAANAKQAIIDWITATTHNVQTAAAQVPPVVVPKVTGIV